MDYSSSEELFGMRLCLLFKSVQQRVVEKVRFILKVKDRGKMIRTRSGLTERTMSYFAQSGLIQFILSTRYQMHIVVI